MKNLCVTPSEHFRKHVDSGRKLDIGNEVPCARCAGKGWVTPPISVFFAGGTLTFAPKGVMCSACNGDGRTH